MSIISYHISLAIVICPDSIIRGSRIVSWSQKLKPNEKRLKLSQDAIVVVNEGASKIIFEAILCHHMFSVRRSVSLSSLFANVPFMIFYL